MFDRGTEPPPNIQSDPRQISVVGYGPLDQIMQARADNM
jgi:hypothetical protein